MTHRKTFLFDIGKVLLDFDFESSLETLIPPGSEDGPARLARVLEPKDAFERGDLPLEDYLSHSLDALGPHVTEASFLDAWRQVFTPNLPMWRVVEELKQAGHRLLLFSNTNAIHCPWMLENFAIFDLFEGGTYSFEVGSMKPEPAIYESVVRTHRLDPDQTLYIDDRGANIQTGIAHGFHSHQYDLNHHAAFEDWRRGALGS